MSEFTQDEYDIIMSEKPKADTNESYKGFLDMKLHTEDVPGTGKGKGSDDWDLGDLMKIKAEEQPKLPPGETPDMMFDTPYIKDEPLMTSSTVKTKHINSLFGPHVTFDDKKNRTYVFDEHELSNNPVAIRMREYRRRKKEGTKVKKGRPKKKGGRRKTRKKRGGQEKKVGQEWKIKNKERLAQAFGNNPVFSFIKIRAKAETPLGGPGKRWKVSPSATRNFSSNTLDMYEFAINKNYNLIDIEPPATDDEDEEVVDDLKGGRRKKRGGSLICIPKKNDDGTDMTYDNNGEPTIGLVLGEKYRFLSADTRRYNGTLMEIEDGGGREHKLRVQGINGRKYRYNLDVMLQPNPIFKGNREERLRKNRMIPCSEEEDHEWSGNIVRADGAGGGKRRKKKTRKMRGGDLNDIKVGSIIGSRYNDNWTHTLGRSMQKWRVVEIEKKPMDLNGIAFVRLRPVNDKGTATGPKTDIIAFWRLKGMFDIVPETKFDIQSRTASGGRKKNTRKKKRGGRPTIKDITYGSAWVHQDTKKRYKISNPYPDLEYKDGGFIILVRDPEYDPNDKKIYKYKKSKDLFQNFALARDGWDGGGEGGGAAASSLRRRIPREGMVIETMGEGNGRVADHEHDGVPRSTPINFNYETEIRELNRRTRQHINEINRMHKDEYGRFKPSDSPFIKHETEWTRKYNEIYNRYNSQKQHLDNLNQQYSTAEVVHENMELVGAPEAPTGASVSGGGRRKKIRRRKVKCGSITVKLKYKSRN